MLRLPRIYMGVFLLLAPLDASASACDTAAALAQVHDAYRALDHASPGTRSQASIALQAILLPDLHPVRMARDLTADGTPTDAGELALMFGIVAEHAHHVAVLGRLRSTDRPSHDHYAQRLAYLILATGCSSGWSPPPFARTVEADAPGSNDARDFPLRADQTADMGAILASLSVAAFLLVRRTIYYRKKQLKRLPRTLVSLDATVQMPDGNAPRIRIVDVSLGGLKFSWRAPPETGTPLTVELDDIRLPGVIVWRNDFYAGFLFDTPLSDAGLARVVALNATPSVGR